MSNHTFTALADFSTERALFARKLAIGSALFATLDELNAIDVQPYVTTMHGQVCSMVRRVVIDSLDAIADPDYKVSVADSIVEHAFDSDLTTAATYVIGNIFSAALTTYQEACDGRREGWYTPNEYAAALVAYNDAFDLLTRTVGPKVGA